MQHFATEVAVMQAEAARMRTASVLIDSPLAGEVALATSASAAAWAFSIAASRSGVSSPAFSSSMRWSHCAPSAALWAFARLVLVTASAGRVTSRLPCLDRRESD